MRVVYYSRKNGDYWISLQYGAFCIFWAASSKEELSDYLQVIFPGSKTWLLMLV